MNAVLHYRNLIAVLALSLSAAQAAEMDYPDLPPATQIEDALHSSVQVKNATSALNMELANLRKWYSGNYEFNLRAGSARRNVSSTGQRLNEWEVALERPLRLPNKLSIDHEIGDATVARARYALGDAHHEAARNLLRLWFAWQREQAQVLLWRDQIALIQKQVALVEKRVKAGDAAKLELNQMQMTAAQANVSLQQAQLRAQLASNALQREFPTILLTDDLVPTSPQPIENDYAYWRNLSLSDNHELGMIEQQKIVQQLLARRSQADRLPDPTLGARYSSETGGAEKVTGVYISIPLALTARSATAEAAAREAEIAADQFAFVQRRLESDISSAHNQAISSYESWRTAREVAIAVAHNAELVNKAYNLGESSITDSLIAQRSALDASLAETLARLDANESRYRLLLDAHQLWAMHESEEQP
jgi:outer membrane protein TolC